MKDKRGAIKRMSTSFYDISTFIADFVFAVMAISFCFLFREILIVIIISW